MFKKVAFTMYPVQDMIRARRFYENILGLSVGKVSPDGGWVEYDLPEGGCLAITTMAQGVSPSDRAGGSIALEVEDLQALIADLKEKDVTFKIEYMEFPPCSMAIILDSEGNAITLHQLKK